MEWVGLSLGGNEDNGIQIQGDKVSSKRGRKVPVCIPLMRPLSFFLFLLLQIFPHYFRPEKNFL